MKLIFIRIFVVSALFFTSCSKNYTEDASWAKNTLEKMTLRQKISQMLVYRMNMRFLSNSNKNLNKVIELVSSDGIGGIHFWYGDVGTALTLLNKIQSLSKIPILIDADIENGLHQRFPEGTELPPFMGIAATGDSLLAYEAGKIVGKEGRSVGIHWNFAPVVDINNNPLNPIINTRSFGEDPSIVSSFSSEYIRGLQEKNMLATAKHFPGHGDTETDSHTSLAQIPSDSLRLWSTELKPFVSAIKNGVDAVMVAHVNASDFQFNYDIPATLSKFWVTDILKDSLNFEGVIVTDAMSMGAITKMYSNFYGLVEAIKAGCDYIIISGDYKESIDILEKSVLDGTIPISRINESALKILRLKEKIGLNDNRLISLEGAQKILRDSVSQQVANEIARKSLTLVKNDGRFFPLKVKKKEKLYLFDLYDGKNTSKESVTTKLIRDLGAELISFNLDETDERYTIDGILKRIPRNSTIIVNAFVTPSSRKNRVSLPENLKVLLNKLSKKTNKLLLNSYGNPYLIEGFPRVKNYICSWKGNRLMQSAFVNALSGREAISGELPISIPGVAEKGDGIKVRKKPIWFYSKPQDEYGKKIKWVLPSEVEADVSKLSRYLKEAIKDSAWPGNVLLASKSGEIFFHNSGGFHTYSNGRNMSPSDIFDLASLSKVISTTAAIMILFDQKELKLDTRVYEIFPDILRSDDKFVNEKKAITIRHLLTHTAGFPPFKKYFSMDIKQKQIINDICSTKLLHKPGDETVYSDLGMILLGKIVEYVTGTSLDIFVSDYIFKPLGMESTFYNPSKKKLKRIVPTEVVSGYREGLIHGEVHDENAHKLGGVAGHAGLFSSARDLAVFSQMMLNGGIYGDKRIFKKSTVNQFTSRALVDTNSFRCLGWDSPSGEASGGIYLSDKSYGHTGYTGTSLWIDPDNDLFVILLTNSVHPKREYKTPNYFDWRQRIHSGVYESLNIANKNPRLLLKERWTNLNSDTLLVK